MFKRELPGNGKRKKDPLDRQIFAPSPNITKKLHLEAEKIAFSRAPTPSLVVSSADEDSEALKKKWQPHQHQASPKRPPFAPKKPILELNKIAVSRASTPSLLVSAVEEKAAVAAIKKVPIARPRQKVAAPVIPAADFSPSAAVEELAGSKSALLKPSKRKKDPEDRHNFSPSPLITKKLMSSSLEKDIRTKETVVKKYVINHVNLSQPNMVPDLVAPASADPILDLCAARPLIETPSSSAILNPLGANPKKDDPDQSVSLSSEGTSPLIFEPRRFLSDSEAITPEIGSSSNIEFKSETSASPAVPAKTLPLLGLFARAKLRGEGSAFQLVNDNINLETLLAEFEQLLKI